MVRLTPCSLVVVSYVRKEHAALSSEYGEEGSSVLLLKKSIRFVSSSQGLLSPSFPWSTHVFSAGCIVLTHTNFSTHFHRSFVINVVPLCVREFTI